MPARTRRQQEVFEIINRHLETNGYHPSYQQIATALKLSARSGIGRIIAELEDQGLLERRHENGHFSIEVRKTGGIAVAWLGLGSIDRSTDEKPLELPAIVIGDYDPQTLRLFRVNDDGMSPEIEEGDIAIIELRDYCRPDQTVLAELADGEIVLRKYHRTGPEITLRPENASFDPIQTPANRTRIIGIHRGLIRPAV